MMQVSASHSADSERAELEIVVAALTRTPRLAKLLSFVAERYFESRTDEITEYNIATEVFGRSKSTFDPSQDSIARVEAYRLRKRLKEYYETEGKEHNILISLPPGSYVPAFTCRDLSVQATATVEPKIEADETVDLFSTTTVGQEDTERPTKAEEVKADHPELLVLQKRHVLYWAIGLIALSLIIFGVVRFLWRPSQSLNRPENGSSHPLNQNQSTPQNVAQVPLRLLAGYQGSPRIDSAGAYWQPDRYFLGGGAFQRPNLPISRTSDPMLFDHWRTSDFSYDIPLAPGPYELHLFFVASPSDDFKTQFFHVTANGQWLLKSFNISADALGANIADEKVFKDIYPDKDGYLHLKFFMERSSPSLNALEILPGIPHRQLPVRLVMQPTAVRDHNGNLWHPDNYFANGTISDQPRSVTGTPDPNLYALERYGHFTYSIPVDSRGRYTLVLHFAELYWIQDPSGSVGVGSRVFRVYCNGSTLLDNFDIFKEAGSLHALTKTFYHLRPSPEGKLDLTFDPITNFATISAIEVIDESE